jgi:tRNA1Val (adenine37-N6)-methyltransferase
MPNDYFQFKQFTVHQQPAAMKVTTDACLFGAWCAGQLAGKTAPSQHVLDIGAGTGLLSLMAAQKISCAIDAVEIDLAAAQQASENIRQSPWKDRITIHQADISNWNSPHRFDYIISNPPFYQTELRSAQQQKNLAHHDAGLQLKDVLKLIDRYLKPEGSFYLLQPFKREKELAGLLEQNGLHVHQKVIVRQSVKHTPFRQLIKGGKVPGEFQIHDMAIKDLADSYTPGFVHLLKDYYLYL